MDGVERNRYFMVTQFAENGSLDQHICKDFSEVTLAQRQVSVESRGCYLIRMLLASGFFPKLLSCCWLPGADMGA